jgi:hypothetical protein
MRPQAYLIAKVLAINAAVLWPLLGGGVGECALPSAASPLILSRAHRVEPKLVEETTFLTWTADNLLRQTVYVGLREDKPAHQVRSE